MMKSVTKEKVFHVLKQVLLAVTVTLVLLSLLGTVAHASGLVDDTVNAGNLYSKYPLSNYQLDFYVDNSWSWLPWNWLDGIGKSVQYGLYCITNFVWTISLYLSNATGYVVQQAYKLDFINDMADSIGKSIQTLAGVTENGFSSSGFYVGFLLIIILIVGVYTAYTGFLKRETSKALHAVINFVVVFIVSASFIAYAPNYIQKINDFSSDISTASLDLGTKIMLPDSQSKGKDSVDLIRDSLFAIQVEKPWLLLQFGNSDTEEIGADRVEALVSSSPSDEDGETRENVVKTEIEDNNNDNLTIPQVVNRLGMVFFLLIFNLGITIFIFLLTGMMLFSQILFIIYAMFLPISFLLSMIPTYENMAKQAVVRVFNAIMTRAGITLIVTVAFSISSMFYNISTDYPFFMVAFLQIVTFAGIYFKLGDLMAMFSLQSSDTQQVGRRIMRRPYMFLGRSARRLERKIGRTVAAGAAGGVAGAVVASNSRKADTAKGNSHTRPNHDTASDTSTFGKRAGAKVGAVLDGKDRLKDKAKSIRQQVKDMPTQAQYAVHSGVNQIQENVSDFKRGIVEEKATRKQGRAEKQDKHRQTVAEKRMELDKAKESTGLVTKGTAPVHERPVTTLVSAKAAPQVAASKQEQTVKERPAVTREQSSVKKEPVTKQQDNVRTQVVRESSPTVKQASTAATKQSVRQTMQYQKQTKSVQKKTTNPSTMKKTTSRKGGKK